VSQMKISIIFAVKVFSMKGIGNPKSQTYCESADGCTDTSRPRFLFQTFRQSVGIREMGHVHTADTSKIIGG
jgi:hypothetical protein